MGTGLYNHTFNFLKFRILSVLITSDRSLTTQEIADNIGINRKRITDELYHWHRCHYGYVKRRGKKGKYYLYIIARHGVDAYMRYKDRYGKGKSLDLRSTNPKTMTSTLDYFVIGKAGKELGYDKSSIPELAGLSRRNSPQSDINNLN